MEFEWDPEKNRLNRKQHHIDFEDAVRIWDGFTVINYDDRDYDEDRWIAIGYVGGIPLTVVHTYPDEGIIRILSARRATRHEEQEYADAIGF